MLVLLPGAAHADWSGDGPGDVVTVHPDGRLLLYRGNGTGGWLTGSGESLGGGWGGFTALLSPGDFSGDGKPDLLARAQDGRLQMYRGDGAGGGGGAGDNRGGRRGAVTARAGPRGLPRGRP